MVAMPSPESGSLWLVRRAKSIPQYKHESNTSNLLAIHGTFCGVATLSVVLRLYVRIFMLKSIGIDDYLIVAADVISIGVLVCFIGEASAGGLGKHPALVSPSKWENFMHWRFFHSLIVMVGISLVKISIACFLRRFVPNKNYQRFLLGSIVFLVAFTISCAGTIIFNCGSRPDANWNYELLANGEAKCFSNKTFTNIGIFNSSINIATDALFAVLPMPIVWKLQTNLRTKFTLMCILGLGVFACSASIVKAVYQATALKDADWTFHDTFFMWNNIEFNVGILAACLPALRPLFAKVLGAAQRFTSNSSRTRQKYADGYDADGLAYRRSDNRARRNLARESFPIGSKLSVELKDLSTAGTKNALVNGQGVTSTVTAGGDNDSDKILLDQEFHTSSTVTEPTIPSSRAIIQTTTIEVTRY